MNRLIVIGASGHGKVVADIAQLNGYKEIVFLDDNKTGECAGFPIIGRCDEAPEGNVFVAIGDAMARKHWMEFYKNREQPKLIHPAAIVANSVKIGEGTVVMAGSVINSDTVIGRGCIINTCSSVDHDCIINDFVHVAVGAHVCGTVSVGTYTWVGAGVIVKNNICICDNCIIGIGAAVTSSINQSGVYIGVPAKKVKVHNSIKK